jgi:hypothetical protein
MLWIDLRPDGEMGTAHLPGSLQDTGETAMHGIYDVVYHNDTEYKHSQGDRLLYKGKLQSFNLDWYQFGIFVSTIDRLIALTD